MKRKENASNSISHLRDSVGEKETNRLSVVSTTTSLGQRGANVNSLNAIAGLLLFGVGDGVGHHQTTQAALVQVLNGLTREDTVNNNGVHFLGAVLHNSVGGLDEGTAGVSHVIDDDGDLVLDVSDKDHAGDLVGASTFLVDQSELKVKTVGNSSSTVQRGNQVRLYIVWTDMWKECLPLGTTSIGTDNDAVADIKVLPDPLQNAGLGVQVVDGDIEEALDLASVQVHGNNVVTTSSLQHVGHELSGDRSTALILLVLASIREVGNDSGNAAGRSGLAGIDHDQEFHEAIVDIVGAGRLQDEDCTIMKTDEDQHHDSLMTSFSFFLLPSFTRNTSAGSAYHLHPEHFHQL